MVEGVPFFVGGIFEGSEVDGEAERDLSGCVWVGVSAREGVVKLVTSDRDDVIVDPWFCHLTTIMQAKSFRLVVAHRRQQQLGWSVPPLSYLVEGIHRFWWLGPLFCLPLLPLAETLKSNTTLVTPMA